MICGFFAGLAGFLCAGSKTSAFELWIIIHTEAADVELLARSKTTGATP